MRLIDADSLGIGKCNVDIFVNKSYAEGWNSAIEIIEQAPTVEAEPVRHGKWIDTREDLYPRCSVCGEMSIDATFANKDNKGMYCSSCGAKMDLKE